MKYLKLVLLFLAFNVLHSNAQNNAQKYTDADFHSLNKNYALALPLYLDILNSDPNNANLNFKVGVCYLNATSNKKKAIPYLEKAAQKINKNYEEFSQAEKKAPAEAFYELGKAYLFDYKFDDAIKNFELYKAATGAVKNSPIAKEVDKRIQMCLNGKELIKIPQNIAILNLSDSVNSEYPDYAPVISADESTLIFTSRRKGGSSDELTDDNQYYEDIYISNKNKNGEWGTAKLIGSNINTTGHEASIGLSADGQQLFIYRSSFDKKDNAASGDIYKSDLNGDVWSVPQKLGSDINTDAWETSAALSSDNQTLYFVSDRKGGLGGRDIYKCVKLPNGEWSASQNMGTPINTEEDEDAPFIHPGGKELYFASKGHKSMGGFDIFFSVKTEDENGIKWSDPVNIGYPINTTDDDVFFATSTDGKRAYYSSFQEGGYGEKDIYQISLVDQTQKELAVVKGYMKMQDGRTLPYDSKISVYNTDTKSLLSMDVRPNSKTGKYLIVLPTNKNYTLVYEVPGCDKVSKELSLDDNSSLTRIDRAYLMDTVFVCKGYVPLTPEQAATAALKKQPGYHNKDEKGKEIPEPPALLNPFELQIFFIYNYNKIPDDNPQYIAFINNVAEEIKKSDRTVQISIEASASNVPTTTFKSNDKLSSSRADLGKKSISAALKSKGVDLKNVKFVKADYLVQGPEYNNDYIDNRLEYEKWQYIRVIAK